MTPITTAHDFASWLATGTGRICVYHTGNLFGDVVLKQDKTLNHLRIATWTAAVSRQVYLIQRVHPNGFEYLAVRPSEGKVPMSFAPMSNFFAPKNEETRKKDSA